MASFQQQQIFVVVLAAGSASRFGSTKQLARLDGTPLVDRAVAAANAAAGRRVMLVVGHDWQSVTSACAPLDGFLLINDAFARGLGSSVALAARTLRHTADALLFTLADQPLVTAEHLLDVVATWSGDPDAIVATRFDGTVGVPALFASACFNELASLDGDSGARDVIRSGRFNVSVVDFPDAAVDIDRPEDLDRV